MKKIIVLILVLTAVFSSACFNKNNREKLATELAAEAMKDFEHKRYRSAIETFNQLRDWYPFDKLSTLAEFKIAEAHFYMKEYEEAIIAYEEFEQLHPRNDAIPYILHQVALCYFNRLDTIDRDQSNAKKALTAFAHLARQFPDSKYTDDIGEKQKKCLGSIAGHELYVGRFYYKSKHYKGAIGRFETVLNEYSGLGYDKEARQYIAKCKEKMKDIKESGKGKPADLEIMPE